MSWLSKLERKYGKYAISNITLYLIICYAVGYVLQMLENVSEIGVLKYLTLDPYAILHGQIWRLVTWIIIPPEGFGIFTLVMLYFYFSIGMTLERTWGTFLYNLYLISGMVFTVIGAFLFMGLCYLTGFYDVMSVTSAGMPLNVAEMASLFSMHFSTYYVCMSIILAFAMTFPDVQVLLMFVIPIKVKVLGIIYALVLGYEFFDNLISAVRYRDVPYFLWTLYGAKCFGMFFSLLSCMIFFVMTRKSFRTPRQIRRQAQYKKKVASAPRITKHKCAICGRSGEEYPELEFRFCSKCNGNYEYCQDHLFTHKHVQ